MIDFLINASKKQIKEFINDVEILPAFDDAKQYEKLIGKLEKEKIVEEFWDKFLHRDSDEKLIELLISKKYARIILGHLDLTDKWLFLLSEDVVEALQTLIVRYYTNGTEYYKSNHSSYEKFVEFMSLIARNELFERILNDNLYLDWLKGLKSDNPQKREYLINHIHKQKTNKA